MSFLPVSRKEVKGQVDFVYVIGDAYVDHPSFGHAIISRVLESHGYSVGIISQPDFRNSESITEFGEPRLAILVSGGNMEDRPMIAWIFENEEYTELYHQIFAEFISEYFERDSFTTMFDQVTNMIAPYVEKDPTKFCTYEEFEKGTETLREFCILRAKSVKGQLDGSIGATTDTQDGSTFIDAGALQIRDMGTMENRKDLKGYSVK